MGERILHLIIKEFIQVLRDPRMKAMIFVLPVIQLLIFGYAVTTDVDRIKTVVVDSDEACTAALRSKLYFLRTLQCHRIP